MIAEILINTAFGLSLFVNALLFVPQIIRLRKTQNSKDCSKITFMGFSCMQILAILYGMIHGDTLIMLGYGCSLLTCGYVTVLLFKYRHDK
jgi:MtN3 and saliva related transmembrane protein